MPNEKRLIDANLLFATKEYLEKHLVAGDSDFLKGYLAGVEGMANAASQCPAVDAVEVVHGRWNEINQMNTGLPWKYRCDKCGCPQDYKHNYCPNCGAKMTGDENEQKE